MRIIIIMLLILMNVSATFAEPLESTVNISAPPASLTAPTEPTILAESAILIEATTGRVIYEKNADLQRPPASMTKMLTCELGLEKIGSGTVIPISDNAAQTGEGYFFWTAGDTMLSDELILGTMIFSDNAGTVAIAEAASGTVDKFLEMMNDKAKELGCTSTHFNNTHGLPDANHYSTARDMARIAMYCMRNSRFRDIVGTKETTVHWINPVNRVDKGENTNKLIGAYDGANGIKTGWTKEAGGCLAASAKRGDLELIAIIVHSPDVNTRFEDAKILLDYGFSKVQMVKGIDKNQFEKTVFVRNGKRATLHVEPEDDLFFPLLDNEDAHLLKVNYELPKWTQAKITKGQAIGTARLMYNDKELAAVPLVAQEDVDVGFNLLSKLLALMSPMVPPEKNILVSWFA